MIKNIRDDIIILLCAKIEALVRTATRIVRHSPNTLLCAINSYTHYASSIQVYGLSSSSCGHETEMIDTLTLC